MILNRPMVAERPAADLGRKTAIDQIGRQVHGDEGELKAAGEEAEHQQHIGAMAERFGQRLPQDCVRAAAGRAADAGERSASDSGSTASMMTAKIASAFCQPTIDQRDRERRKQELAERAGRRAERRKRSSAIPAATACRKRRSRRERAAGQAEADQHAGRNRASPALVACAISSRPSA